MKRHLLYTLAVVILHVSASHCPAQGYGYEPYYRGKLVNTVGQASIFYDSENDQTTVEAQLSVYRKKNGVKLDHPMRLSLMFFNAGKSVVEPQQVQLVFTTMGETCHSAADKDDELFVEADERRVKTVGWLGRNSGCVKVNEKRFKELLEITLRLESFKVVANAKKVSIKFGATEIELDEAELAMFRDVLRTTAQ